MSKLFNRLVVITTFVSCIAYAANRHNIPVGEGISILTRSNMSLANSGDWFLVLYAPWCGHCQNLIEKLPSIHDRVKDKVMIGCANADADPSLQMRFGMQGFPTLFRVHNGEAYRFPHTVRPNPESISQFLLEGYKKETPVGGFRAPFGITMRLFGFYSAFAIGAFRFLEVYANKLGIPPMWFFCGVAVLIAVLVIVVMLLVSGSRKPAKGAAARKANSKKNDDDAITANVVQRTRAENPIEGAAIAETEKVQDQVKKVKEEQKLHRRAVSKDEQGAAREQQKKHEKRESKSASKGGKRQQNMPTQQPSKH